MVGWEIVAINGVIPDIVAVARAAIEDCVRHPRYRLGVYMSTRVVALTRSPGTIAIERAIDPPGPRRQLTGERPKYWAGGGP